MCLQSQDMRLVIQIRRFISDLTARREQRDSSPSNLNWSFVDTIEYELLADKLVNFDTKLGR